MIKEIKQKDRYTFTIEWMDGIVSDYKLSELQKHCPCVSCREQRLFQEGGYHIHEHVMAFKIKSIGRFALKVEFTSGCSKGIYTFSLLRRLKL